MTGSMQALPLLISNSLSFLQDRAVATAHLRHALEIYRDIGGPGHPLDTRRRRLCVPARPGPPARSALQPSPDLLSSGWFQRRRRLHPGPHVPAHRRAHRIGRPASSEGRAPLGRLAGLAAGRLWLASRENHLDLLRERQPFVASGIWRQVRANVLRESADQVGTPGGVIAPDQDGQRGGRQLDPDVVGG